MCLSSTRFLYPEFKKNIDQNTREVLKSGFYILGEKNKKLEQRLSKYLNVKFFTTVATGTDALTIAVKALSLGKDDEVIVPANVYPSVFGIALSGVRIRLADVDEDSLNISPEAIEKTINKNTKVIVLVHLYGNPANITDIKKIAKKYNLFLVEDCAQSIGAEYKNKKVGSFGDISVFSFYPTKNLGAFGDGGAIATNDKKLAKKIKLLRMYGEKKRYESVLVGHNSRFDEIQAGILLAQLDDLDLMNNKRRKIAKEYIKSLKNLPIKIIEENKDGKGVYHLFVIRTNQRNKLADYLNRGGIEIGIHYPNPIHLTKGFKYLGYRKGDFPVSEIASSQILSIPVHPFLTNKQVLYICSSIKEFFRK
ncbi:hypothetical protein A2858_03625 [Candidatus Daviesbacteria bacterium RIFCSPHIGHO2_01_FULL_36_37]|uniref:Erythromycin biosynthesis sensory transduction protein eryC1 n=1 Tax=Candidatus Daviesbacteria bacterium RIFCSPHIGHO2_01_FULL_36_37 TaxID=1797758 RepID=A0A1F5IND9_9BACT|nr:MAG: hypothetical protein A2858_03625 [Candidatus Daviesbacteria bacterium RIFCSPHIGHO2_01_FULL_36_37]